MHCTSASKSKESHTLEVERYRKLYPLLPSLSYSLKKKLLMDRTLSSKRTQQDLNPETPDWQLSALTTRIRRLHIMMPGEGRVSKRISWLIAGRMSCRCFDIDRQAEATHSKINVSVCNSTISTSAFFFDFFNGTGQEITGLVTSQRQTPRQAAIRALLLSLQISNGCFQNNSLLAR